MYTYTHEIKGGKTVCLARFLSYVSYLSCVVLNAKSANNSNLSLFHSDHSSGAFCLVSVPLEIWF